LITLSLSPELSFFFVFGNAFVVHDEEFITRYLEASQERDYWLAKRGLVFYNEILLYTYFKHNKKNNTKN
jgi:hypothetical protein